MEDEMNKPDMSELLGMDRVVDQIVDAVVHGKNLLLVGPPGCTKTMLARRVNTIMPRLTDYQRATLYETYRLTKLMSDTNIISDVPPFRAPHHSLPAESLSGNLKRKSGELQLARFGVLFLDQIASFTVDAISQLASHMDLKDTMVITTSTPCPCGWFEESTVKCTCTGAKIGNHLKRIQRVCEELSIHDTIVVPSYGTANMSVVLKGDAPPTSEQLRARVLEQKEQNLGN
jgi:magnesium chelatase family protein